MDYTQLDAQRIGQDNTDTTYYEEDTTHGETPPRTSSARFVPRRPPPPALSTLILHVQLPRSVFTVIFPWHPPLQPPRAASILSLHRRSRMPSTTATLNQQTRLSASTTSTVSIYCKHTRQYNKKADTISTYCEHIL